VCCRKVTVLKAGFDLHDTTEGPCLYVICEQNIYFMNFSVDTNNKQTSIQDKINKTNYKLIKDNKQLEEEQEIKSKQMEQKISVSFAQIVGAVYGQQSVQCRGSSRCSVRTAVGAVYGEQSVQFTDSSWYNLRTAVVAVYEQSSVQCTGSSRCSVGLYSVQCRTLAGAVYGQ